MENKENFNRKVLDNGMTIIFERRELPVVSIAFASRGGGINESLDEKGISHFIEHMLPKRTGNRDSKEIAEEIEKKGGEFNAFTDEEVTAYWCKMPSEHFLTGLNVLTDIVKNPVFASEDLEKERQVILEEIKMRHDNPAVYSFDSIQGLLYKGTLSKDLIGDSKTIGTINKENIQKKFYNFYDPKNLVLCVVGNVEFSEVEKYVEENFSSSYSHSSDHSGNEGGRIPEPKIELSKDEKSESRQGLQQANLVFAHHVDKEDPDRNSGKGPYVARVLSELLAGGMSSRLFDEIREKRNLAYAVKGEANINKRFAYNLIYVGTTKENVEKVKELILEEYKKVTESLKEKELEEVKEQLIGNLKISMEDSNSQLIHLLEYEIFGNARNFYNYEENIRSVSLEDVKSLAKEVYDGNYSFFSLVPEKASE